MGFINQFSYCITGIVQKIVTERVFSYFTLVLLECVCVRFADTFFLFCAYVHFVNNNLAFYLPFSSIHSFHSAHFIVFCALFSSAVNDYCRILIKYYLILRMYWNVWVIM